MQSKRRSANSLRQVLALLLLLCSIFLRAQNYPVDIQFRVFPPYSPSFHTFGASGGTSPVNKTQLILQLKDPLRPSIEVGLQWEIKNSQGVVRSTAPITTAPITLVNGIPSVLSNAQLAPWFDPAFFAGLGLQNGTMPEGDYEICVTAYELIHQTKASEASCAYFYVTEFDPPDLIHPLDSLLPSWPQAIQFMWQPLHPGGFPVQYTLEVWEEIPGMTSEQIVNNTPPYFVKTITQATSAFLTEADPHLHIGTFYLSRVTVRDRVNGPGGAPVYVFKNGGQSVVRRFKYGYSIAGEDCQPPQNLDYKLVGTQQRAFCFWDGGTPPGGGGTSSSASSTLPPAISGDEEYTPPPAAPVFNAFYTVKWHEKGDDAPWQSKTTSQKWWELKSWKRGKTYQVVVVKACSDQEIISDTLQIKFNKFPDERPYECGMPPIVPDTAQIDPLPELLEFDTIIVNDTRVIITKANGGNGNFSGEGFFSAPLIKRAKIAVEFSNITVNDEYRMVKGEIKTKYDPTGSNILSLDSLFNLFNNGNEFTVPEITLLEGDTAYYDPNGNLVVIQNGQMSTYGPPLVVHSPSGSAVFSGGYVMPIWEGFEEPEGLTPGFRMEFARTDSTRLGFDPPINPALYDKYEQLDGYRMAYKCTARGAADQLRGYLAEGNVPLEDIKVFTEHGAQLNTYLNGSNLIIYVAGVEPWERVYAMAGDTCVGVFQQVAYELVNYKIHLVSVNGVGADLDPAVLQNALNTTLVQGAALTTVDWSGIAVADTATIIDAESHLMTVYSDDMNRIIGNFETAYGGDGPSPVEFYLFLVNNLQGNVQGFMPEGTNYGFIDITKGDYKKTIPHELGHGAFTLRHYWEDYGGNENTTDNNLMDYSPAGTTLLYDQWNTMHDPRIPVPWFRGDDDAALIQYYTLDELDGNEDPEEPVRAGITPNGKILEELPQESGYRFVPVISSGNRYCVVAISKYKVTVEGGIETSSMLEKTYKWDGAAYKNGAEVVGSLITGENRVKIFDNVDESCLYKYQIIQWNGSLRSSSFTEEIKLKVITDNWIFGMFYNPDPSCTRNAQAIKVRNNDLSTACADEETIRIQKEKLIEMSQNSSVEINLLAKTINSTCLTALRALGYPVQKTLFGLIGNAESVKEEEELALLRLMHAFPSDHYLEFYDYLEESENKLIKKLINDIDDTVFWFIGENNKTNFIGALCWMYSIKPRPFIEETDIENFIPQVIELKPKIFSTTLSSSENWITIRAGTRYGCNYNYADGTIQIYQEEHIVGGGPYGMSSDHWYLVPPPDGSYPYISPMSTILITKTDEELPLVETALGEGAPFGGMVYVAPAIFLKYRKDKINAEESAKNAMIVLDLVAIYGSGGTVFLVKQAWNARRIWAAVELAGGVSSLLVNTGAIPANSKIRPAIDAFNIGVGIIGLKYLSTGLYRGAKHAVTYIRELPPNIKLLINNNKSIKAIVFSKYLDWRVAIASLEDLNAAEKQLIFEGKATQVTSSVLSEAEKAALVEQAATFRSLFVGMGRFIAHSGDELRAYLNGLVNKPSGVQYDGDIYRSLSITSETNFGALPDQMTDHHIYSSWGRYDLPGEENAMYLSKTVNGNQTEIVPHYGLWSDFSTYTYTDVHMDNLLDLTDDVVRQQLGTEFDQLVKVIDDPDPNIAKAIMYEYTNELAKWARQNGYNGLIVPGARGGKDYENIILFEQNYINQILQGKTAVPIPK